MINYIFNNWQFLVTLFLALAAIVISIKALRSSRNTEVALGGDEPSVMVDWYKTENQTMCNLHAFGEVRKASLKLGRERKVLDSLDVNRSQSLNFPFIERGTHWEVSFTDPATGKILRQKGKVRYS
jgi:hypothetical protein